MPIRADDLVEQVERDGYFVARGFFDRAKVLGVRAELDELFERDIRDRKQQSVPRKWIRGGTRVSVRTETMHTVYFPLWSSPGLRGLADELFDNPEIRRFCRRVIGEHFRLRVDLVRKASGVNDSVDDFQLPHAWHRDSPGEFTFGIFLDDLTVPGSGGTAVIPGTHWQPFHPLFDLAVSSGSVISRAHFMDKTLQPRVIDSSFERFLFCNRRLRHRLARRVTEVRGHLGDIYFFVNDVWHGRAPNVHGGRNIMVRIGGFASEFEFKDDIGLPENPDVLPDSVARHYRKTQPMNNDGTTLLQRIQRRKFRVDLPRCACWEKRVAGWFTQRIHSKS